MDPIQRCYLPYFMDEGIDLQKDISDLFMYYHPQMMEQGLESRPLVF